MSADLESTLATLRRFVSTMECDFASEIVHHVEAHPMDAVPMFLWCFGEDKGIYESDMIWSELDSMFDARAIFDFGQNSPRFRESANYVSVDWYERVISPLTDEQVGELALDMVREQAHNILTRNPRFAEWLESEPTSPITEIVARFEQSRSKVREALDELAHQH